MNTTATIEQSFEQQLVNALSSDDISSNDLYSLVEETQLAIVTATNDATVAEASALDPLLSPDASEARRAMEDAKFRAARLVSLLPRLRQRVTEIADREEIMAWHARFDPLALKVEAAATKLATVYAKVTAELVPLLAEAEKLDAEVKRVQAAKPYAAQGYLRSVELTARRLKDFPIYSHEILKMQLPDWQRPTELLWPPNRQPDYSNVVPVYAKKHPGDKWWELKEQEAAEAAAKAEVANAEQTQKDGAARETRFQHHDLSDWKMKQVG